MGAHNVAKTKNKIGLQFDGWKELLEHIDKISGESGLKSAVESGLIATKEYINGKIDPIMVKNNMPAGGIYWGEGKTKKSLNRDLTVEWVGFTGTIDIGFDFEISGLVSIFLMYGTPRMKPAKGLKDAIYGKKTKQTVKELQANAINDWIGENL
jgi:hypothetical protein